MGAHPRSPFGGRSASLARVPGVLAALVALLGLTFTAPAVQPADGTTPDIPDSGLPAQFQPGEIKLSIEKFGVDGECRAGEWVGIRVQVTDTSTRQREIVVGIRGFDPDGDTPVIQRSLTTNPGVPQSVWVYLDLPYNANPNDPITITAHEAIELPADDPGVSIFPYSRGRLLGQVTATPRRMLDPVQGMIGIIGKTSGHLGLQEYANEIPGQRYPLYGHEVSSIVTGIAPDSLPDRWAGLAQYDVLVWKSGPPSELRGERAEALREWVVRGGHLVIVLPGQTWQTWTNAAANEIYDLLPAVSIEVKEGVDLEPFRPLFMKNRRDRQPPLPSNGILLTLTPQPDAKRSEAIRILNGPGTPDGRPGPCIVARRLVGTGMVTLVGLDLNQISGRGAIEIDADIFWHRILGRRGPLEDPAGNPALGGRAEVYVDQDIGPLIAKTGTAATGILLGFVIFAIYWVAAGPGGFAVLKHFRQTKHAWVAYVGAGAAFTAVAWTGATLIRPMNVAATHFTIVDYVYGNDVMRARSWCSLLIPRYGDATIRLGREDAPPTLGERPANLIAPWDERRIGLGASTQFPDARDYSVDSRSHDALRVPVRATVKQLEINWAGPPVWKMPIPCKADGSLAPPTDPEGQLTLQAADAGSTQATHLVNGRLIHHLPAPLEDVLVIVVKGQTPITGTVGHGLIAQADAFVLAGPWPPGEPQDLADLTQQKLTTDGKKLSSDLSRLLDGTDNSGGSLSLANYGSIQFNPQQQATRLDINKRMRMLALYGMLEPPPRGDTNASYGVARRASTHGLDLSAWFTQPCVIVMGQLGVDSKVESPVPILVDGRQAPTEGRTFFRWIYPLAENPPSVTRGASEAPAPAPTNIPGTTNTPGPG